MTDTEKAWCLDTMQSVASEHFNKTTGHRGDRVSQRTHPVQHLHQLGGKIRIYKQRQLAHGIEDQASLFCNEVVDKLLIIFDELLDWVVRIDNVLRNPLGHLLLVGESGVGKRVLTKFVAWTGLDCDSK